ncbi:MAG TPA: FkbM family methyltransferase [Rhodocyclaceae bacterium]|nr:FkbM family methyltransferase [Rhodocyclaceae bacterium]
MLPRVNILRGDHADYLTFSTQDTITQVLYLEGSWAGLLQKIGETFCSDVDAPLILDIGANMGAFAIPIAKNMADRGGLIYAFEPQRIVYYQLCGNVFLNRLDNIYAFNMALGNTDTSIEIPAIDYSASQNIGAFSLDLDFRKTLNAVTVKEGTPRYEVPLQQLDNVSLPKAPTLIKIDVEGLEIQVLQGAAQLLKASNFPPLLLEAWKGEWFKEQREMLIHYLHEIGYTIMCELGEEIIAQNPSHHRRFALELNQQTMMLSMGKIAG